MPDNPITYILVVFAAFFSGRLFEYSRNRRKIDATIAERDAEIESLLRKQACGDKS